MPNVIFSVRPEDPANRPDLTAGSFTRLYTSSPPFCQAPTIKRLSLWNNFLLSHFITSFALTYTRISLMEPSILISPRLNVINKKTRTLVETRGSRSFVHGALTFFD